MAKNIIIVILAIIAIGEGVLLVRHSSSSQATAAPQLARSGNLPPAGPNAKGAGKPIILSKGMNLKSTPLFKYAYQIAPGDLSADAKKVLTGFNITTQKQSDGSLIVSLTPKNSEDQSQQYTVKVGNTLYFIEQTPFDDKKDQDKDLNYRDDYGIIVDAKGVIQ